ncbi:MAG: hypothetical protein ACPG5U_04865 [Planktomarina sp.]
MKLILLVACFGVMGCSSLNPVTAFRLARTNPLTVDPSVIRVLVAVPEYFAVKEDSVLFRIYGENTVLDARRDRSFVLQHTLTDGMHMFQLSGNDVTALLALQAEFNQWKDDHPDASSGGYSVKAQPCSQARPIAAEDLTGHFSVFIELDPETGPMSLLRNVPLSRVAAEFEGQTLPMC